MRCAIKEVRTLHFGRDRGSAIFDYFFDYFAKIDRLEKERLVSFPLDRCVRRGKTHHPANFAGRQSPLSSPHISIGPSEPLAVFLCLPPSAAAPLAAAPLATAALPLAPLLAGFLLAIPSHDSYNVDACVQTFRSRSSPRLAAMSRNQNMN